MPSTKMYQLFQDLNKGIFGCIYFDFAFTIPPAIKPNNNPMIKPILTFFIKNPIATPIKTMVKKLIFLRGCMLFYFEAGKPIILANNL